MEEEVSIDKPIPKPMSDEENKKSFQKVKITVNIEERGIYKKIFK
jgi:hypothetical protein